MNDTVFPMQRMISIGVLWMLSTMANAQSSTSPILTVAVSTNQTIAISWPASAQAFVLEQSAALGPLASWQAVTQALVLQGDHVSVAVNASEQSQFYRLHLAQGAAGFTISGFTPLDGATDVGVTVRPQIFFSQPVNPASLGTNNFYASFGGQPLPATVVPAGDGSFAWLFLKQPMPGGGPAADNR